MKCKVRNPIQNRDILEQILEHAELEDLIVYQRVSRTFQDVVRNTLPKLAKKRFPELTTCGSDKNLVRITSDYLRTKAPDFDNFRIVMTFYQNNKYDNDLTLELKFNTGHGNVTILIKLKHGVHEVHLPIYPKIDGSEFIERVMRSTKGYCTIFFNRYRETRMRRLELCIHEDTFFVHTFMNEPSLELSNEDDQLFLDVKNEERDFEIMEDLVSIF